VIAVAALVVIFTPQIRTLLSGGGGGLSSDEAPIYVKNGSMDITSGSPDDSNATHWKWIDSDNDEFSHEDPLGTKGNEDGLYVMVFATARHTCDPLPLTGKNIDIDYDDDGRPPIKFKASFRRGGNGGFTTRVKRRGLQRDTKDDWLLTHVEPSGTNRITGLRVFAGSQSSGCAFEEDDPTLRIIICTDPLKCPKK
jgi:hypothetical protein